MKKYPIIAYNILPVIFLLTFIGCLSSCKTTYEPQPIVAYLSVYNFTPSYSTYDIYVGNKKKNSANIPYGGGAKYDQYLEGNYDVKFTEPGTSTTVFSKSGIEIKNNEFNTFFVFGLPDNFQSLTLKDDFGIPESGKAYVRFVNLSDNAPNLDFALKDSTTLSSDQAYKSASKFFPFDTKSTIFEVKDHNTGVVLARTDATVLKERYFYTVVAGGRLSPGNLERNFGITLITQQ